MAIELTPLEALQSAVDACGSQNEFARKIGVSQPTVWKWLQTTKRVGDAYVVKVAELSGIPPHILRPDLYPKAQLERFYGVDHGAIRAA